MASESKPVFFTGPAKFDAWLARHGADRSELVVGYWKVGTGKPSMTWAQSVEVALRHGWIDGVRNSLGPESYTIRFTPRKPTSNWSLVNVRTANRLLAEGRMTAAGRKAFEARLAHKTGVYSAEQHDPKLTAGEEKALRAEATAWTYFAARAPSYQKACRWWVASAKRPETRQRRLQALIASSRAGRPVPQFAPRPGKGAKRRTRQSG